MATNGSMNCTFSRIFPRIVEQSIGSAADHLLLQQQHICYPVKLKVLVLSYCSELVFVIVQVVLP